MSGRYPKLVIAEVSDRLLVYEDGDSTAAKALVPWRVELVKVSPMFNECYSPVAALPNRSTFNIGGVESRQEDRINMKKTKIEEWNRNPTKYRLNRIRRLSCVLRDKLLQLKAHGVEVLIVPPPKDKVIEDTKYRAAAERDLEMYCRNQSTSGLIPSRQNLKPLMVAILPGNHQSGFRKCFGRSARLGIDDDSFE